MTHSSEYGRYIKVEDGLLDNVDQPIDVKRVQTLANNVSHHRDTMCQQRISYLRHSGASSASFDVVAVSTLNDDSFTVFSASTPWTVFSSEEVATAVLYLRAHGSVGQDIDIKAGLFPFGVDARPDMATAVATWDMVILNSTTAVDVIKARASVNYNFRDQSTRRIGGFGGFGGIQIPGGTPHGVMNFSSPGEPSIGAGTITDTVKVLILTLVVFARTNGSSVGLTIDHLQLWEIP